MQSKYYGLTLWDKFNPFKKRYKVVICLHGGAGWCMGYWGVIWALQQQGIIPVGFVSRSSGTFIALSYAFGWSDKQGRDYYGGFKLRDYLKNRPGVPLFDINKYHNFTEKFSTTAKLQDLKVPIYITSVNHSARKVEYLHDDISVTDALTLTTAIPGMIGPVEYGGSSYFDGEVATGTDVGFARYKFKDCFVLEIGRDVVTSSKIVNYFVAGAQRFFEADSDYPRDMKADYVLNLSDLAGSPFSTDFIDQNVKLGYDFANSVSYDLKNSIERFYASKKL